MFLLRRTIEVRHMHQRRRLLLDRADQMGMAVAQDVDRDAACEIQKTLAALVDQIATVAAHGTYVAPGIDGHKRRDRHHVPPERGWIPETQKGRSEERRVGKECGRTCRFRWSP